MGRYPGFISYKKIIHNSPAVVAETSVGMSWSWNIKYVMEEVGHVSGPVLPSQVPWGRDKRNQWQ